MLKKIIVTSIFLTFPAWGTILFVALVSTYPKLGAIDKLLVCFMGSLLFFSALPIFKWNGYPTFVKFILSVIYYSVSAFVVFIFGWISSCWFTGSCH